MFPLLLTVLNRGCIPPYYDPYYIPSPTMGWILEHARVCCSWLLLVWRWMGFNRCLGVVWVGLWGLRVRV